MDTGAARTLISEVDWVKAGRPKLHKTSTQLALYDGAPLKVLGEFETQLKRGYLTKPIKILVIPGKRPPVLGLRDIRSLKIDLNQALYRNKAEVSEIFQVKEKPSGKLENLLGEFKSVFSDELGCCTKIKAHISLKPNANPKFSKSRQIAFSKLEKVK